MHYYYNFVIFLFTNNNKKIIFYCNSIMKIKIENELEKIMHLKYFINEKNLLIMK